MGHWNNKRRFINQMCPSSGMPLWHISVNPEPCTLLWMCMFCQIRGTSICWMFNWRDETRTPFSSFISVYFCFQYQVSVVGASGFTSSVSSDHIQPHPWTTNQLEKPDTYAMFSEELGREYGEPLTGARARSRYSPPTVPRRCTGSCGTLKTWHFRQTFSHVPFVTTCT